MSGTEFQTGEWGLEGLDLNYFAARYYDPIIGRWHAPDPLEQCHSPYLAMLGDPANFIDPDGRAGIPFLQDFMKSDGGTLLLNLAGQATFLGLMLKPMSAIGGVIQAVVNVGFGISALSNGTSVAEFTCNATPESDCSENIQEVEENCTYEAGADNGNTLSEGITNLSEATIYEDNSEIALKMHLTETKGAWDSEYIVWKASFTIQIEEVILEVIPFGNEDIYFGMPRNEWNEKGNFHPNNIDFPIRYREMTHGVQEHRHLTFTSDGIQFFHRGMSLAQSSGCFVSSGKPNYVFREIQSGTNEAGITSSWEVWDCFTQPFSEPSLNPYDRSTRNLQTIKQLYDQLGGKNIKFDYRFGNPCMNNDAGNKFLKTLFQLTTTLRL
jgi:RHS repeat-associated protein